MALKLKFDSLKEIPAEDVLLYVEREGAWHLDADLKDERAKLAEFRTNNVALLKQLEEQAKKFEGIDPEEVRKLADEKRTLEEQQRLKAGEFDKVLDGRLKAVRSDFDKQISVVAAERDAMVTGLTVLQI